MILRKALTRTSIDALLDMVRAGATSLSKDLRRVNQDLMPSNSMVRQINNQARKAGFKNFVRYATFKDHQGWCFSITGYAVVLDWIDRGYDMLGEVITASSLATLRPSVTAVHERVRKVSIDELRRS